MEKTLQNPLDCKEIKLVNPKGNQPWILIGRTDAEAETPILWPPDVKSWLIGKDPGAGKDRRQKEKGAAEDEMIEWHHWLDGHEFEQTGRSWRTEEPGVLQSLGSQGVRHDWATEQHVRLLICRNGKQNILRMSQLLPLYQTHFTPDYLKTFLCNSSLIMCFPSKLSLHRLIQPFTKNMQAQLTPDNV